MTEDEMRLLPEEARAAAALRGALSEEASKYPFETYPVRLPVRVAGRARTRWPLQAIAACLAVIALGSVLAVGRYWPTGGQSGARSTTSVTFDNGDFSFTYPSNWTIISGQQTDAPREIDVVVGTGTWKSGCTPTGCGTASVDVSGGRIVLKVYRQVSGPPDLCRGNTTANATLGANAVQVSTSGSRTTWEIRFPYQEFGQGGNLHFESTTESSSGLAEAQAAGQSFHWSPAAAAGRQPVCAPGAS